APPSGPIDTGHRSVGAAVEGRAFFYGSAGQSFGAWCVDGAELELEGEANDYVGKGMSGGLLSIRPFAGDGARDPVLAGNTCLYGATGGRVFIAGRAGERFCVRNSGAVAVVEGAGDHFCEYMTGGVAVSLGGVGRNAGAGMTGGVAYLLEWVQLHPTSVVARPLAAQDARLLREILEEHLARTGSPRAAELLADWAGAADRFRLIVPAEQTVPQAATAPVPAAARPPDGVEAKAALRARS
ncbi:MAG: glutamate synthase subunit alpha, partial [Candidatus Dormibacteraceae bacterium]